jgi:hypothetical protein
MSPRPTLAMANVTALKGSDGIPRKHVGKRKGRKALELIHVDEEVPAARQPQLTLFELKDDSRPR